MMQQSNRGDGGGGWGGGWEGTTMTMASDVRRHLLSSVRGTVHAAQWCWTCCSHPTAMTTNEDDGAEATAMMTTERCSGAVGDSGVVASQPSTGQFRRRQEKQHTIPANGETSMPPLLLRR
jgi:hypothetical protein